MLGPRNTQPYQWSYQNYQKSMVRWTGFTLISPRAFGQKKYNFNLINYCGEWELTNIALNAFLSSFWIELLPLIVCDFYHERIITGICSWTDKCIRYTKFCFKYASYVQSIHLYRTYAGWGLLRRLCQLMQEEMYAYIQNRKVVSSGCVQPDVIVYWNGPAQFLCVSVQSPFSETVKQINVKCCGKIPIHCISCHFFFKILKSWILTFFSFSLT